MVSNLVVCNKCGWVYFAVSREFANMQVETFNTFFYTLSKEKRKEYYGNSPSHISNFETCYCGNSYKNFHEHGKNDIQLNGSTINPILYFGE